MYSQSVDNEILQHIRWPHHMTKTNLVQAVSQAAGLPIVVKDIPAELRHPQVSGMTVLVNGTAHVFYDSSTSLLNQQQALLHELAHVLHGDLTETETLCCRTQMSDPVEIRAERTATAMMIEISRRHTTSPLEKFLLGGD